MMKEGPLKKRRRDVTPASSSLKDDAAKSSSSAGSSSSTILTPVDLWSYEEQEVDQREAEKDLTIFRQTCEEISKLMKEIRILRKQKNAKAESEISERRIQASLLFITLKKLNRLEKLRSKKARDATNEAKQRVDNFQLQLQNLLYESLHLKKEVDKCLEFKSTDEEIQLVPVEEFYKKAPEHISKIELTKNNPHQLMLARLDWELEQRKQLAGKCEEARSKKDDVLLKIKKKQEKLDKLVPQLKSLLQASKPLQSNLDVPLETKRTLNKTAYFLPRPLFILYVQANAYHEACDDSLTVNIEGDVEEVRAIAEATEDRRDEDSPDSDQEESVGEKRHRRRGVDHLEISRKKLLRKHPLSVILTVNYPDRSKLVLRFSFLTTMHIVTVGCSLHLPSTISDFPTGDVLSADTLFSCLFPNDFGNNTPNPMNHYQLQKLGLDEFSTHISELGRPYLWAQRLAGMDFLPSFHVEGTSEKQPQRSEVVARSVVSTSHMEQTIRAIHQRFKARIALHRQIASFSRGVVPVSSKSMSLFPAKITSRLSSFKSVGLDDHLTSEQRTKLAEMGIHIEDSLAFQASIERGSAKLIALIIVAADYPNVTPFFRLSLNWKYERMAETDNSLWALEREVNVYFDELLVAGCEDELITNQMQRLLMCFDIYLETETANNVVEGPVEFPKEKIFMKPHKGRDRSKPYKYLGQYRCFSHR